MSTRDKAPIALPPLPNPPCEACLSDPACRLETPLFVSAYCRHRKSGAYFDGNRWTVLVPVESDEFVALVARLEERATQVLLTQQHAAGPMN